MHLILNHNDMKTMVIQAHAAKIRNVITQPPQCAMPSLVFPRLLEVFEMAGHSAS
jgi:hypothetical protein